MAREKKQISAMVDEDEKLFIEEFCREEDISIAQLIRKAIKEYIERHNN